MSHDFYGRHPTHQEPTVRVSAPNPHYRFHHGVASLAGRTVARHVPTHSKEWYALQRLGTPAQEAAADAVVPNTDPGMRFYYQVDPTTQPVNEGAGDTYGVGGAKSGAARLQRNPRNITRPQDGQGSSILKTLFGTSTTTTTSNKGSSSTTTTTTNKFGTGTK